MRIGVRVALACACALVALMRPAGAVHRSAERGSTGHLSRITGYSISPNGHWLALTVVQVPRHGNREQIVIRSLVNGGSRSRVIYSGDPVSGVRWLSARRILFVRERQGSALVDENVLTRFRRVIVRSPHVLEIAAVDRRRGLVAYEYAKPWRWGKRLSVRMNDNMSTLQLIEPKWARPAVTTLRAIKVDSNDRRPFRNIRLTRTEFNLAPTLIWRRGQLLAVEQTRHSFRTRLVDLQTGRLVSKGRPFFRVMGLAVSRKGRIALTAMRVWKRRPEPICGCTGQLHLYVPEGRRKVNEVRALNAGHYMEFISGIWWAGKHRIFVQVVGSEKIGGPHRWWLEEINWKRDQVIRQYWWPNGDLGGWSGPCELDARRSVAVCEGQTLTTPPKLVEVDLRTGKMRALAPMNPTQRSLDFSFREVRIHSRFGAVSTGFLALPAKWKDHRVPLAVMAYGFTEAYSRDAQWITSYPIARFVHSGIAVLLIDWAYIPGLRAWPFSNELKSQESAISTFKNAVPAVRASGVRISRAMVMGWSFGGLFAADAIQRLPEYVAAQVGDPAAWNVTEYGLENDRWRNMMRWGMGGPPVRRYIQHYLDTDPAGDGKPALGPILLEFVSRNPDAGQFLEEWRAVGTDVEAFAYRRSVHWLSVPAEARISRLRNLYWAKLNLFGPRSVTSAQLQSVGLTVPPRGWWTKAIRRPITPRRLESRSDRLAIGPRLPRKPPQIEGRPRLP